MRPAQNTSRGGAAESRGARGDGELCCLKKVKIIHCKKSFLFSLTRFHVFMKVPFFYWHFMWKNLKITRLSCALDNQAEKRRETHQAGAGPWLSVNTDGDFSIKVVTHMQTAARNPSHAHRRHRPQAPAVQAARPRPPGGRGQVAGRLGQWAEHPPRRPVKPWAAQGRRLLLQRPGPPTPWWERAREHCRPRERLFLLLLAARCSTQGFDYSHIWSHFILKITPRSTAAQTSHRTSGETPPHPASEARR